MLRIDASLLRRTGQATRPQPPSAARKIASAPFSIHVRRPVQQTHRRHTLSGCCPPHHPSRPPSDIEANSILSRSAWSRPARRNNAHTKSHTACRGEVSGVAERQNSCQASETAGQCMNSGTPRIEAALYSERRVRGHPSNSCPLENGTMPHCCRHHLWDNAPARPSGNHNYWRTRKCPSKARLLGGTGPGTRCLDGGRRVPRVHHPWR